MPQIKVYGLQKNLEPKRLALSHAIHAALMETIGTPTQKRFQRFIMLEPENFIFPSDRSNDYTIIEISMFKGRSIEAKKNLIRILYQKIAETAHIESQDLEVTIFETPQENWGIRGVPGDELKLNYQVDV
ncbi:tautomerase family protein [Pleurocapsa sp. CCALA 161]|uniref:tautomerase family protein n=1 Tax=Pleurocapsa sp. CCALA 161 TaxID=2107688 RepID=UPI000D059601|nr:tautomerase family protein [Pleurocapsa sp. CCALA 161]PSB12291.1 tautomerase family protein [Pleurocapsa sp. CCALA 161]